MKLRHLKFSFIVLLSYFLIAFQVLAQSVSFRANVSLFGDYRIIKTIRASTIEQLENSIYDVIRPSGSPLPTIDISLGNNISLNELQNNIQSQGVSEKYYEYVSGGTTYKSPWININISSIGSSSSTYGVSLSRSGYGTKGPISFRVTEKQGGNPTLRFDRTAVALVDQTNIDFTVEAGRSGIDRTQLGSFLHNKDSRLNLRVLSDRDREDMQFCKRNPAVQRACPRKPNYSISLFRD